TSRSPSKLARGLLSAARLDRRQQKYILAAILEAGPLPARQRTVPDRFDRGRNARIAHVVALEVPHTTRPLTERGDIHGTADAALLVRVPRARLGARGVRSRRSGDRGGAEE